MNTDLPPLNIPELLRKHGLHPDKRLGQNYLIDHGFIQRVIETAKINAQDSVLEIGAGVGNLTRFLALYARRVIAVEIDGRVLPVLDQVLAPHNNVEIIHADILQIDPAGLFQPGEHPGHVLPGPGPAADFLQAVVVDGHNGYLFAGRDGAPKPEFEIVELEFEKLAEGGTPDEQGAHHQGDADNPAGDG